jgi:hypothetical protein
MPITCGINHKLPATVLCGMFPAQDTPLLWGQLPITKEDEDG